MEVKLPLTMIHSAQGAPGYHLNRETPKESKANIDKVWHHHFARIQSEHRQSLASPFCWDNASLKHPSSSFFFHTCMFMFHDELEPFHSRYIFMIVSF